jgi:hypothetical protein
MLRRESAVAGTGSPEAVAAVISRQSRRQARAGISMRHLSVVSLHALARRFQRAFDVSDAAIFADLRSRKAARKDAASRRDNSFHR